MPPPADVKAPEEKAPEEKPAEPASLPPLPPEEQKSEDAPPALPSLDALTSKKDDNVALKMVQNQTGKSGDASLPPLPSDSAKDAVPPLPEMGKDKTNKAAPVAPVEMSDSPAPLPPLPPVDNAAPAELPPLPKDDAKPADAPKEQEMASLPEEKKSAETPALPGAATMQVSFSESETEVPLSAQPALQELAKSIIAKKDARVSVVAYASGGADQASLARRVSLRRGLAVRAFLIDMGVDNFAITVNAHGNKNAEGGPAERVDIFVK